MTKGKRLKRVPKPYRESSEINPDLIDVEPMPQTSRNFDKAMNELDMHIYGLIGVLVLILTIGGYITWQIFGQ